MLFSLTKSYTYFLNLRIHTINHNKSAKGQGLTKQVKWAWGIIDLKTRIPLMYHCLDKTHSYLVSLIKKHTLPGAILYSDSHSSYYTFSSGVSKLVQYGYYHFWICHMIRYVHEKFGFVHTAAIE